jgi:arylsulfatase A-like enzyme
LDATGLRSSTTIVFTTDHGEEFWDHGGYEHGHQMYDELVRVPLFVAAPSVSPRMVPTMTRAVDIAPTALIAMGLDAEGFSGQDLLQESIPAMFAYGEATLYGDEQKFLRSDEWKVVTRFGETPTTSVFDVRVDPAEQHDLARSEPTLADSLGRELVGWIERVGTMDESGRGVPDDLSPAERARLEAVGYVGK